MTITAHFILNIIAVLNHYLFLENKNANPMRFKYIIQNINHTDPTSDVVVPAYRYTFVIQICARITLQNMIDD